MLDEWASRPSQPNLPTSTHQETLFAPVNLSLLHFSQDIKAQSNPLCSITNLTHFNGVPKVTHGTEKVNLADMKLASCEGHPLILLSQLALKGLTLLT